MRRVPRPPELQRAEVLASDECSDLCPGDTELLRDLVEGQEAGWHAVTLVPCDRPMGVVHRRAFGVPPGAESGGWLRTATGPRGGGTGPRTLSARIVTHAAPCMRLRVPCGLVVAG